MMKYFKNSKGKIFAFEADGSQDKLIDKELEGLSTEEIAAIENPSPSRAQLIEKFKNAVNDRLEAKAKELGFDSMATAVSYADEPADPVSQEQGRALRAWRSRCTKACREMLAEWDYRGVPPSLKRLPDYES